MRDWEYYELLRDHTMVPKETFLENLRLARSVKHVNGTVVECGTWRGGMLAALAGSTGRASIGIDSFQGLPPAEPIDGETALAWQGDPKGKTYRDNCRASRTEAEHALHLAKVHWAQLIEGWIPEVLPEIPEIAILRLDVDWYQSIYESLKKLYPRVNPGGLVILDDYFAWDGCAKALHRFLYEQDTVPRIRTTISDVCYLIKPVNPT